MIPIRGRKLMELLVVKNVLAMVLLNLMIPIRGRKRTYHLSRNPYHKPKTVKFNDSH